MISRAFCVRSLFIIAGAIGCAGVASATYTYNPTLTGVNIWSVPVDIYTHSNVDPTNGGPLIANCSTSSTIRACIRSYLQTWQVRA
jgi:hypothetical protein